MKIFFKEIPEIKTERRWRSDLMRDFCVKHNYYTGGDCEAYAEMLEYVDNTLPTEDNMFKVAYDIFKHTPELNEDTSYDKEDHIAGLMYGMIADNAVFTLYTVEDFDD